MSKQIQFGNAVTVMGGNVIARLSGAKVTPLDSANSGIVLAPGVSAQLSLQGLKPNSEVRVVIYSEPRQLGILPVDSMGGFFASIDIPTDLEPGSHTLVISGLESDGFPIELKFGLVVNSSDGNLLLWWVGSATALLILAFASSLIWFRKARRDNREFWQSRLRGGVV
ncbi:MAG: hypothetical protein WC864_11100 [Ilumatobacteraceae bacterium]